MEEQLAAIMGPWTIILQSTIQRFLKMVSTRSQAVGARDVGLINLLSCRDLTKTQFPQLKLTSVAKWTAEINPNDRQGKW